MDLSSFFKNVLSGIIVTLLILMCQWLADSQTKKHHLINLEFHTIKAERHFALSIKIFNASPYTIDKLEIKADLLDIISYSTSSSLVQLDDSHWVGQLNSGDTITFSIVYLAAFEVSTEDLTKLVRAGLLVRDENTGSLVWESAKTRVGGPMFMTKELIYIFWFLLPVTLTGMSFLAFLFVRKFYNSKSKEAD